MRVDEALARAVEILEAHEVPAARLNSETLLMFTLQCDRAHLYGHPERELSEDELERFEAAIALRAQHSPTQYITGHQEFWGLDFVVSPAVLIPRPETEHSVEAVLEIVRGTPVSASAAPRIIDVGTGSGCIALALASELPDAEIEAVDISPDALGLAQRNAERLALAERVRFYLSDLLGAAEGTYDVIVSNPPYVGEDEPDKVQREVREHEPHVAVFGGKSGLDIYRRLVPQALGKLRGGGHLVMEIGYSIEEQVRALMTDFAEVRTLPDLQGIPRVVVARK